MSENKTENPQIVKAINAFSQNKFQEAENICLNLLQQDNNPDANHILGCIRMGEKKYDESIKYIEKTLALQPENIGVLISLGCAQSSKKSYDDSIKTFKKIVKLKKDISQVHFYLGEAYRQKEKHTDALDSFKNCLSLTPDHIGCQLMIGIIYEELKKFDQAIKFYKSCISTFPEYMEPHINLGMCYLLTGNYSDGWNEYEWRLKLPAKAYNLKLSNNKWKGQDISGKKLLVIAEQSPGDTFQFIRFAKMLAMEGAKIIVVAQEETIEVLKNQKWITKVLSYDDNFPEYDYYTYLISIAKVLEWNPKMDTQQHPYLSIDKKDNPKIMSNIKTIGLMVEADPNLSNFNQISIPKKEIDKIFSGKDFNIINIPIATDYHDFSKTINEIDLLVSIESDLVHLAGALNVPTWVMLPVVPKHTWDLNFKTTSPWYPSLCLFRQQTHNNWDSVLSDIQEKLNSV